MLRWSFGIPVVRSVPMAYTLSGFYRTLELMLRGGYTVPEALREARRVVQGTPLIEALDAALPQIERGKTLTEAFGSSALLSGITRRLIAAGERTGRLADVVGQTALHYERQLERSVMRASRVVEPVLLMGVASVIALVVFLMYSPIFDLASSISL
jgi:general secretion pathway protein F